MSAPSRFQLWLVSGLAGLLLAGLAVLLWQGLYLQKPLDDLITAGVFLFLGCVCVFFLFIFLRSMQEGDWPAFEANWGGLGGGIGGWRVSPALTYLLSAMIFAGVLARLYLGWSEDQVKRKEADVAIVKAQLEIEKLQEQAELAEAEARAAQATTTAARALEIALQKKAEADEREAGEPAPTPAPEPTPEPAPAPGDGPSGDGPPGAEGG